MKSILGLLLLALLAIFGSRYFERKIKIPAVVRRIFAGGMVFLYAGILMGPSVLGLIDRATFLKLSPVVTIALFWIGLIFGVHLKIKDLKRISPSVHLLAYGQSILTYFFIAVIFYLLLGRFFRQMDSMAMVASVMTLAACASGTSQGTLLRLTRNNRQFRGPTAQVATVTATLDDIPAIISTGLLTFFIHVSLPGQTVLPGMVWMGLALVAGIMGGWIIKVMLEKVDNEQGRLLILLGTSAVGGGLCAYLHLSPIFVGTIMGAAYANFSARNDKVFDIMSRSESTLYVLFLVLVGSMIRLRFEVLLLLVLVYVAVRIVGKILGGMMFPVSWPTKPRPSRYIGLALLPQGGLAIAIAIHYQMTFPNPMSELVVSIVIMGIVINELYAGPLALRTTIRRNK